MTAVDAIVLAGGRASRMGGVDKPAIVIGGRSMLDAALTAAASCGRTVVVGPHRPELDPAVVQVREVPPGSGPVAAIGAGLAALGHDPAPRVVVLAADVPFLTEWSVVDLLRRAHESGADAVFAADESGRPQYLIGVWRRSALAARLQRLDSLINQPMKALVPDETVIVPLPGIADCDTAEEVRAARAAAERDRPPVPLDEAREILRTRLTRLTAYTTELREVRGAALAAPIVAADALPRFDVSAMDGYAVAGEGPWRLRADIGFAGGQRPVGLLPGEAVQIATGAHVPDGTAFVLRDEFAVTSEDQRLHRRPGTPERSDIRRRGEDRAPGDPVAPAGTPVTAALVSAAAAVEVTEAPVRGPVRARIVMTGDEIRSEGPLQTGQTRDSIGPILPDLLTACGIRPIGRVHLRDTPHGFDEVLASVSDPGDCDLLVIVGATGSGAADQLRAALHRAEAHILVHRLRLRPGGSTVVAELPSTATVLGLPGNPFAAVATLLALAPALVEGRTAAQPARPVVGPLHNAGEIAASVPRIVPARHEPGGGWTGDPAVRTAHLGGLLDRDGLVIVPAGAVDATKVEFLPVPR
ncbi:NTP transferase domain-containing protein [Nocardia donostiensis]|uniref:Molybdopterin molybdenumtransferase n=1 Tax=Nocardia donostiensis TaxID=1538463 RepID=A0A1W0AUI5_9NOCA|nr:NTP transferase domain-containing protein [Nocardia donostiensis]ONM48106.1 molybdenum cofactor biosynthesis protein [Nocardia donostiensis]OQS13907.1 molybdenum cofactor biosynthesis protein [Nocardia donostiensis]OQS20336.1 molybdenum cofactor biosynthesis protein [Nocardia donostiensis]